MVYFLTKNLNYGLFLKCILYGHFGILRSFGVCNIWFILWSFGIYFPIFGILHCEKSGNPDRSRNKSPGNFFSGSAKIRPTELTDRKTALYGRVNRGQTIADWGAQLCWKIICSTGKLI
jgi:hypothetical protein